jgi:hypothetical protein
MVTYDVFSCLDTNGDANLNLGDSIDQDHLDLIVEFCDSDNDDTVT